MPKTKEPPDGATSSGQVQQVVSCAVAVGITLQQTGQNRKVDYYPAGVLLSAGGRYASGKHQRSKRGAVSGFSKSSRRRMRRFMLENSPPMGWPQYGVTLTIPGPTLPDDKEKRLFAAWCLLIFKAGGCAVWRLELQARGSRHWHCIVALPPSLPPGRITRFWWESIDDLGPFRFDPPHIGKSDKGEYEIPEVCTLMNLPGAYERACVVDQNGSAGAWLRYMQDHASKDKREQCADGKGRHWGVIGRDLFQLQIPAVTDKFTDGEYFRFLRSYQRLCTPSKNNPKSPFGRSLGYRPSRGSRGTSVWFSRPETVKRLADWARGVVTEMVPF